MKPIALTIIKLWLVFVLGAGVALGATAAWKVLLLFVEAWARMDAAMSGFLTPTVALVALALVLFCRMKRS